MPVNFYRQGASGLGIGVENLAFQSAFGPPVNGPYSARYVVGQSLAPSAPGFVRLQQDFIPVSLLGANGAGYAGRLALQALAQLKGK